MEQAFFRAEETAFFVKIEARHRIHVKDKLIAFFRIKQWVEDIKNGLGLSLDGFFLGFLRWLTLKFSDEIA